MSPRAKWVVTAFVVLSGVFGLPSSAEVQAAPPLKKYSGPMYEWKQVTLQAPFAPRDGAGALTYHGKMFLIGGWNPQDKQHFPLVCSNDVWSSDNGSDWKMIKPNTHLDATFDPKQDWEARHTAGYVIHRDKMWIIGGDVNQKHYQSDVWNSTEGVKWNLVNPDRPVPWGSRTVQYTVAFRDKIWIIGGQTISQFTPHLPQTDTYYRDVWNSSDGVEWQPVLPKEPFWEQRGMIGGSVVFQDRLWLLGGGTYDTSDDPERKTYNDVWSTADGVTWKKHVDRAAWAPREYHDVAVFDGRMWVLEGYLPGVGNLKDVWHSDDGVHWYEVPRTPWKPRHAASVFVHNDALWMVAGNNMESDVWKLVRRK